MNGRLKIRHGSALARFPLPRVLVGVLMGMTLWTLIVPRGFEAEAAINSLFCVGTTPVRAMGTSTHEDFWMDHVTSWLSAKYAEEEAIKPLSNPADPYCASPNGLLAYDSVGDDVATDSAVSHQAGDLYNPHLLYSVDLALSPSEYAMAYLNYQNVFTKPLASMINHFPTFIHGVAVAYNLSSCPLTSALKLSSRQLSLIYSGVITRWNDPLLVIGEPQDLNDDNPGLNSCNLTVSAAIRLDSAASTVVVKDYMSQQNDLFDIYKSKELNTSWPTTFVVGCRGLGDLDGMTTCLSVPGRIGYISYEVARDEHSFDMALLRNAGGQYLAPATDVTHTSSRVRWPNNCPAAADSLAGAGAASGQAPPANTTQDWSRVSMTGATNGYPMCQFAITLVYQDVTAAYLSISSTQEGTVSDFLTVAFMDAVQASVTTYGVSYLTQTYRQMARTGLGNMR